MRQKDFEYWVTLLSPLIQANRAIIKAYQDASVVKSLTVEKGFCQFTVPRTACLLSVSIGDYPVYPEFSGNQYRMTIRLLSEVSGNDRPIQSMLSGNIHLKVCEI
jgi:cell division FtsZ-interacting protein ZapD